MFGLGLINIKDKNSLLKLEKEEIQADGIKVYVEEICGKGGTVGSMAFTRKEAEKRLKELQE